jgi:hypothetical protein
MSDKEGEYYHNRAGRLLEASDIARMEQSLFMPAMKRCAVTNSRIGNPVYYMRDEPLQQADGLEYRHSFYSTVNNDNQLMQYTIFEEATQSRTIDQDNVDECNTVRDQYQKWYAVNHGNSHEGLSTDKIWQSLYDTAPTTDIALSITSIKSFVFNADAAQKAYTISVRLVAGGEFAVLDEHNLSDRANDVPGMFKDQHWSPEEIADMDQSSRSIGSVTTKDMDDIVGILEDLNAVSFADRDRFIRGI